MSDEKESSDECYVLRLYVAGMTARSSRAIENLKEVCETNLKGRYSLEIIDIEKHPELAKKDNIITSPTLVKTLPLPMRNLVGDMTRKDRVYSGLNLSIEKGASGGNQTKT